MDRPYFFSIDGKYDAGPVVGHVRSVSAVFLSVALFVLFLP